MNHYQAEEYDVIVVGAGHAGSEAALVSRTYGVKNVTINDQFRYGGIYAM